MTESPLARVIPSVVVVALIVLTAVSLFVVVRRSDAPREEPANVAALRIDDPLEHWRREGFVPMVPPVRLPTDAAGKDHIQVWLRLGDGPVTSRVINGAPTLVFPPGTIADRVESVGDAVVDVRGTTLAEDGVELFHVYVAESEAPAPLVGWEWRRGNARAEASATTALLARLKETKRKLRGEPTPPLEAQRASLVAYEKNNNCASCHVHDKPAVPRGNVVHRPTDDVGFFVPLSVLSDSGPLERHRPYDPNPDDPFLDIRCDDGRAASVIDEGARRHLTCAGGEIPRGTLDVARALAAGDERARAMCASRRYLYEHMDEPAKRAFAGAMDACATPSAQLQAERRR